MSTLTALLADKTRISEAQYQWGESTLQVHGYLCDEMPPTQLISSARCIVLREDEVLTIADSNGEFHIVPGGRCEAGETPLQTMQREVLEETGWMVLEPHIVGFVHFRHLTDKPLGYRYPYPDFLQVIYAGGAGIHQVDRMVHDPHVSGSEFRPIANIFDLIPADQLEFLKQATALKN